jgi:hypothetical protein
LSVLSAVFVFFVITWLRVLHLIQPSRSHTDTEFACLCPYDAPKTGAFSGGGDLTQLSIWLSVSCVRALG